MNDVIKKCPFFKEDCLRDECKLYHTKIRECSITMLPFNTFKMNNLLEGLIEEMAYLRKEIREKKGE